jgi:proteasome assembly chaperone 2
VSTANVGQLAADVLIASLRLERIGVFDPQYFIPVVGAREDGRPGITTPYECKSDLALLFHEEIYVWKVYGRSDLPLVMVQQRSPVLKVRELFQLVVHDIQQSAAQGRKMNSSPHFWTS